MNMLCKYYTNITRLANGMDIFSNEKSFRFFCLTGTASRNKDRFSINTKIFTACVSFTSSKTNKAVNFLLTSDPKYKDFDGKRIDIDSFDNDNVYYNLCILLQSKFKRTGNTFVIDFRSEGETISIESVVNDKLSCTIRGIQGRVRICSSDSIAEVLKNCNGVKSFKYTILNDSPELSKQVLVEKSQGEIFKEISNYLKKTVVLVSLGDNDELIEQYVSSRSVSEIHTLSNGSRYKKIISPVDMKDNKLLSIYCTTAITDYTVKEDK